VAPPLMVFFLVALLYLPVVALLHLPVVLLMVSVLPSLL